MGERVSDVYESFYLETEEGMYFTVKGMVHPPDRFIAYLRYAPDPHAGERFKEGRRYRRLYHFAEQEQYLQANAAHYLFFDPVYRATLQGVPRSCISRVYDPRARLQALARQPNRDTVEDDALAFALLLQQEASVPLNGLGLSGSLLIGLHTPHSDLDLTVHGAQNCRAVHQALKRLLNTEANPALRRNDPRELGALYTARVADTHMAFDDFQLAEENKVNQGRFREREYFIRFLKEPAATGESYGDYHYAPCGRARLLATVTDASEAIFTPCRYGLADVQLLDGLPGANIVAAVSFRGRFCEQAQEGQRVLISGMMEQVTAQDGTVWHRLLLGNHVEDSMVLRR